MQEMTTNNVTLFLNRINPPAGSQLSLKGKSTTSCMPRDKVANGSRPNSPRKSLRKTHLPPTSILSTQRPIPLHRSTHCPRLHPYLRHRRLFLESEISQDWIGERDGSGSEEWIWYRQIQKSEDGTRKERGYTVAG